MEPVTETSHWLISLTGGVVGALIAYIVAVVGFRDTLKKDISDKVNKVYEHCEKCRHECVEVREMSEAELENKLKAGDIQFTYIRLLLEDVICEKLEIPKEKIERIQKISGVNQVNLLRNKGGF